VRGLGLDRGEQVGRTEIRVYEAGQNLAEAERQEQVIAGDRIRGREVPISAGRRQAFVAQLHLPPLEMLAHARAA
jgi:hypothetical protein